MRLNMLKFLECFACNIYNISLLYAELLPEDGIFQYLKAADNSHLSGNKTSYFYLTIRS